MISPLYSLDYGPEILKVRSRESIYGMSILLLLFIINIIFFIDTMCKLRES